MAKQKKILITSKLISEPERMNFVTEKDIEREADRD